MLLAIIGLALAGCEATDKTVVGVYDSRVIALAYWQEKVDGKERLYNHEALGMKAIDLGVLMHQQVFSYHEPVQALEYIADKLPEVMEQAGVDVIVSKWEKEKLAEYDPTKFVDITDRLVQLYNPTAKFLKDAEGFKKSTPEPLDTNWLTAEE